MVKFTVNDKEGGKRLKSVFFERYPNIPSGAFFRALRNRDVKINGTRTGDVAAILEAGDEVTVYVDARAAEEPEVRTVFENEYIVIAEKPQGLLSEPDANRPGEASLIELARAQITNAENSEAQYELCHRLDRNTGGMIFISKKPGITAAVKEALNARYYKKIYTALVIGDARGILPPDGGWVFFKAQLRKDDSSSRVFVSERPSAGSREIITGLRFAGLSGIPGASRADNTRAALPLISRVEAMLVTGRTHQLRAHLAFLGYPIAGDGKYGSEAVNRLAGLKYQALWASRYEFDPDAAAVFAGKTIAGVPVASILPETVFESEPRFK